MLFLAGCFLFSIFESIFIQSITNGIVCCLLLRHCLVSWALVTTYDDQSYYYSIALTLRKYLTLHTAAAEESYRQANDPMIIEKESVSVSLQNDNNFPQQHIRPWSPVHTVHVSGHWWCTEPPAQTGGWSPSGHCAALFIVTRPQSQAPHEP